MTTFGGRWRNWYAYANMACKVVVVTKPAGPHVNPKGNMALKVDIADTPFKIA